jgi:thiol-disulfide isomerase/thioredoxin
MLKIFAITLFLFATVGAGAVSAQHEYAPIEEKTVNYQNWTFKNIVDGSSVDLRQFAQGKKLVMVVYFAPWCPNWKNEGPVALSLYQKYHKSGLEIVAVSEYASIADAKAYFGAEGPPYTVVSESEERTAKQTTTHYTYRKATGDTRNWGSPWNIFLIPSQLNPRGEVLTEKAFVVNGELIEADTEKFIREHLGLDTKSTAVTLPNNGTTTACEPEKPTAVFKKP